MATEPTGEQLLQLLNAASALPDGLGELAKVYYAISLALFCCEA